jgi:hypothetical protein
LSITSLGASNLYSGIMPPSFSQKATIEPTESNYLPLPALFCAAVKLADLRNDS